MNTKKVGSAAGAFVVVAAVLAGMKHVADKPAPAPNSSLVEISAPAQAAVGELVVLSVEDSEAGSFSWQVVPPTKHFMVIDNGRRAVFSSGSPGDYLFIVGAAKGDDVGLRTHTLKVTGSGPSPAPVADDLTSKVIALANAINSPTRKEDAAKLSQSFASVAAAITAGAMSDPNDIITATKSATQAALGPNKAAWTSFLQGLQAELKAMADAGRLPDAKSHASAWQEIADALRAVAEAT